MTLLLGIDSEHNAACRHPYKAFEAPFIDMLKGWVMYAENHLGRYETPIGEDYVMGQVWENIGHALLEFLNGETGPRLNRAHLNSFIRQTMKDNGIKMD